MMKAKDRSTVSTRKLAVGKSKPYLAQLEILRDYFCFHVCLIVAAHIP